MASASSGSGSELTPSCWPAATCPCPCWPRRATGPACWPRQSGRWSGWATVGRSRTASRSCCASAAEPPSLLPENKKKHRWNFCFHAEQKKQQKKKTRNRENGWWCRGEMNDPYTFSNLLLQCCGSTVWTVLVLAASFLNHQNSSRNFNPKTIRSYIRI